MCRTFLLWRASATSMWAHTWASTATRTPRIIFSLAQRRSIGQTPSTTGCRVVHVLVFGDAIVARAMPRRVSIFACIWVDPINSTVGKWCCFGCWLRFCSSTLSALGADFCSKHIRDFVAVLIAITMIWLALRISAAFSPSRVECVSVTLTGIVVCLLHFFLGFMWDHVH
jgi:hypothetical protein